MQLISHPATEETLQKVAAALEAEQPAMFRRLRLGEAAGEPLLEFAQVAAGHVAQPIARMRASSSSWSTGFTR